MIAAVTASNRRIAGLTGVSIARSDQAGSGKAGSIKTEDTEGEVIATDKEDPLPRNKGRAKKRQTDQRCDDSRRGSSISIQMLHPSPMYLTA